MAIFVGPAFPASCVQHISDLHSKFALGTQPPPQKWGGALSSIFGPCLLWPNGWMDQHGTWHGGGPWSRPHCARCGTSSPPPKKGQSPQFSAHFYCHQTTGCIKMSLGIEVSLSPCDFVLDVDPASPPLKCTAPNFRPMPIVAKRLDGLRWHLFDGDPATTRTEDTPTNTKHPVFGLCLLWPIGWMDEDATWYGSGPWPRPHCIKWGSSSA